MTGGKLGWYIARARCMTPGEFVTRAQDEVRKRTWERRRVRPGSALPPRPPTVDRKFRVALPEGVAAAVPAAARDRLLESAEALLAGHWRTLGVQRHDLVAPDWFLDPRSCRRAPADRYAFRIQHRSEDVTGNVKQVWELSRHQHLTVLAAAYYLTGDGRYATRVAEHLLSWWAANPFLTGVQWTSGIETGLRLIAWVWIRRLLDDWPAVSDVFDDDLAVNQLYWHQQYLAAFRSRGSSANNHVIAEAAGGLVAADAFPWFAESRAWRASAADLLSRELARNTFASGVNRELASEYHGFVAELAYVAAVEADAAGDPLPDETWTCICRMTDAAAALVDAAGRPPRQGDGDDGTGLRIDGPPPPTGPWSSLLGLGGAVFGRRPWWPRTEPTVFSTLLGSLVAGPRSVADRPAARPPAFLDAGIVLLRSGHGDHEIWCRCDSGPHGFLRTAAHAHADALSIEVRHGGVDILADPGTYCYNGERAWRNYFRSTAAHNTVEVAGRDQSRSGGPTLWLRHAKSRLVTLEGNPEGELKLWSAEHDGYRVLSPGAEHRRTLCLDDEHRTLTIVDSIETSGAHALALRFHLGPAVTADLDGAVARLSWVVPATGRAQHAVLALPPELRWRAHRGETDPVIGWYSSGFGEKEVATTLVGSGSCRVPSITLRTLLEFQTISSFREGASVPDVLDDVERDS